MSSLPAPRPPEDRRGWMLKGPWWWAKLLLLDYGAYDLLCPWPLGSLVAWVTRNPRWSFDSIGTTAALVLAVATAFHPLRVPDPAGVHEVLGNIAFGCWALVAGMLALVGCLPDTGILKRTLRRHPENFADHIRPWLAALVLGVATATIAFAWEPLSLGSLPGPLRFATAFLAWRGGAALLGAVLYGTRLYAMALYVISRGGGDE